MPMSFYADFLGYMLTPKPKLSIAGQHNCPSAFYLEYTVRLVRGVDFCFPAQYAAEKSESSKVTGSMAAFHTENMYTVTTIKMLIAYFSSTR
jgi:hypothetical protein